MARKQKTKLPFKAKTMGSYQREIARSTGKKDTRAAVAQTSTVTVFKPDENGNMVAVETVAPVLAKPATRTRRPKLPKGSKSLL